jgi:hypothetical protein
MEEYLAILGEIYSGNKRESYLLEKYGKEVLEDFRAFSQGFSDDRVYVARIGVEDPDLTLTHAGIQEYHRLRGEQESSKRNKTLTLATIVMGAATAAIMFGNIIGFISKATPNEGVILSYLGAIGMFAVFATYGVLMLKMNSQE